MRTFKRSLALVLAIAMVLTTFGMTVVSAAQYNDTEGHWAESYINTWSGYGVIQGDGGYFRPDDAITRAEVAQVTDNVISYEKIADNMFTDVSTTDWFADAVLKLVAAGTLTGNGDGTMTPNNYMTREEAMTMLARAYGLTVENTQAGITQYADYQNISDYATGYVGAMTAAGYVGGYEDGTIRPKDYISRAEFVKIIDNMIKLYITEPGSYGPEYVGGIVMIKTGGVTLNGIVAGGVVVSPQVSGDVTITGSQISGDIVNLSEKANVTSNTGNVTNPSATTKPNNIVIGGGGSGGGGNGGGPASLTVKFHYGENYGTVKTRSVTKGKKLSESSVPTPTESNWDGLWYTSKSAAEKCSGTTFDPTVSAVNKNYDLYAGHINNYDLKDVEIAVDNKTDYVNVYVGDVLTATNLAPAAAKNYVSYQWYRTKESNGTGDKISGATKSTYTAVEADKGMYLKVVVTGDGTNYNGTVSDVSTIVLAKDAPSIYPEKTTAAFGNDAATTVTLTEGQTITGVKTESGEMLTADQYTFDAETGKLTISKDYLAGLTDGQNVFTIVVSDDAAYNVTFVVTTTGGPTEGPVPTEEPEPTATPVTPDKPTATPVTPDKPTATPVTPDKPTATPVTPDKPTATPVTPDKPTATPVTPDKPTATPVTPDKPTATPVTPDKPTATPVTPDEPTATPLPTATVAPIQKYVATVNVTGGKAVLKDANGNTYPLVEVSNPTEEPVPTATASTEEPTEAPATAKPTMPPLTEITESYTFIADDFNSAGTLPISEGTMLDNGKVYSPAGNNAATNKKSSEINGASHLNSMRLKGAQNSLVFKTAVDVAVTVYGNAHDSRVYAAGTTNGGVELGKGQTGSGVFTFNASAGTTVYLTAVNDADNSGGDLFIAGFTVEPTANAAAEDGAVQYLIPEGDVVTVDATPDTAGLYPIVTVKGADGQDIAVSDNKFTMPGQNVTTEVTFGDAPATETPAPTDAPVSTIAPIPAKGMTLPSGVNTTDKSSKVYNWNDKATDEMKAVFGDPLTGVNTEALVPMGAADRTISAKINVSAEQAGSYKLMVLGIEYSNRYYNVKVDSGNAIAPENTNPGKVALIDPTESNSDLTITTYDLGELTEGEHTISVISAANNSRDFFAMGFVKYTPAPATETPAPTEEPATATPEPSATAEPTEAPATETPAPSATAMPIDDYIKANIDDVNNQLVDGDVQYAQLVPNYDNSTVDVEVLDGTIKNMSVVKSIEAAIGLVNKYDPVAKYAVHYDGSDYATVSAANEAATNFDTVDNRPDGYKSYNPVTVFGKDDSPSAIAIGKAVSASLGLNTEQFNSISTTDLATFLGYLEANSKYSVNVTAYGADGNSIFTYKFIFADKQPVPTATAEPTATPEATATAAPIVVNMFDKSAVAISAGSQDTGLYWDNTKSGNMALIKSSVVGSFEGAQGIILREGTSGAVSVNVYKTKATTATDVDATQIATREIKMTGGYTPNYDNIISFEDGTTFESDDNILIKLSAIDHSSYCGNYSTCTISFDMPRYDIALDTFENGVASINSKSNPTVANAITKAAEGELVFVTATANADYELADVQYKGASESDYTKSASIAGAKTTAVAFEMPGEAATVKPIINALTYVTASISADNGSVTFTDGVASDTNRAITGKNVSFTVSANDGYAVESVKVMAGNDDVSSSVGLVENLGVYSFTTPLTDFTVTVNYIEAKAITVASVSNGSVSVENVTRPELIKKELNTAASVTWKAYDETANAIAANATDPDPITIDGVGVVDLPNNNDSATATDKKWTRGTSYKFDSSIGNFTGSISGGGNPRPSSFSGTPSATNLPAAGTVFEFTAAADGQMQIAYFAGSGKTLYLLESEPNADKGTQLATFTGANANAITDVFEVKAGNTYYFFGGATKAQYFGFKFVPYNYTILGVAGDTIKVNATPESGNYVVDTVTYATATEPSNSIPVVDNGDGYTFEMPNDAVTVNATFVNSII